MPTREEIVKALRCETCVKYDCPYYDVQGGGCYTDNIVVDAADLIEQQAKEIERLQAQHELLADQYEKLVNINDKWCEERDAAVSIAVTLKAELAEVKAERDTAIADLYKAKSCNTCARQYKDDCLLEECMEPCSAFAEGEVPYEWRGVKEEPHAD